MTKSRKEQPQEAPGAAHGRRRLTATVCGIIALVVATAIISWRSWSSRDGRLPVPFPALNLRGADKAVVEAIDSARQEVRRSPDSAGVWGRLAMILFIHDGFRDAEVCFARAEELDPGSPRWPYLRGLSLFRGEARPAEAVASLRRAVERCGDDPTPRLRLGEALFEQGQLDEAERLFRQVLDKESLHPRANLGLGRILHSRGRLEQAVEHLEVSLQRAPSVKMTHALLAEIHFRLADPATANLHRERMARLSDTYRWPDRYFAEALKHFTGVWSKIELANAWFQQGKQSEAIEILKQTVRKYPEALMPHLVLAQLESRAGRLEDAEQTLRETTRISPDGVEANFELGAVLQRQQKHEEAVARFRRAVKIKPDFGLAHYHLGLSLLRLGDPGETIEAFRETVRYRPDLAAAHRILGQLLLQAGERTEALKYLRQAADLDPGDSKTRQILNSVTPIERD